MAEPEPIGIPNRKQRTYGPPVDVGVNSRSGCFTTSTAQTIMVSPARSRRCHMARHRCRAGTHGRSCRALVSDFAVGTCKGNACARISAPKTRVIQRILVKRCAATCGLIRGGGVFSPAAAAMTIAHQDDVGSGGLSVKVVGRPSGKSTLSCMRCASTSRLAAQARPDPRDLPVKRRPVDDDLIDQKSRSSLPGRNG
jgi:hypothetical protein